jgi:Zn-dependent oligopeptidase
MADSPKQIFELIESISKKAKKKALKEIEELTNYFKLKKIDSEDLAYYSRIFKEEKYSVDEKELKKYFEFENTISYLHNFTKEFFGIELKPLSQPLCPHPNPLPRGEGIDQKVVEQDIRVYEVYKD